MLCEPVYIFNKWQLQYNTVESYINKIIEEFKDKKESNRHDRCRSYSKIYYNNMVSYISRNIICMSNIINKIKILRYARITYPIDYKEHGQNSFARWLKEKVYR